MAAFDHRDPTPGIDSSPARPASSAVVAGPARRPSAPIRAGAATRSPKSRAAAAELGSLWLDDGGSVDQAMPIELIKWMKSQNWGKHHDEWHGTRRWDTSSAAEQAANTAKGWTRAKHQEGTAGNGLEFLAMHHVMLEMVRDQIKNGAHPEYANLLKGWMTPPTHPEKDKDDPLPEHATTPFDPNMLAAIKRIETQPNTFATDDEFGLFLETKRRPTEKDPAAVALDPQAGLHNYLHGRWEDLSSPMNMGDPTVNIFNQTFWRLHGWIDAQWMAWRKAKGLKEDDPVFQHALQEARECMLAAAKGGGHAGHAGHVTGYSGRASGPGARP